MYFMLKLREAIEEVENLVLVSDRYISIANAISIVFPEAHHRACAYHIKLTSTISSRPIIVIMNLIWRPMRIMPVNFIFILRNQVK